MQNLIADATPDQLANMLTAPIVKLYKRCARNKHDTCPGMFEAWSICSCQCHSGVSDERPAPITCADKVEAVAEAIAITAPRKAPTKRNTFKGSRNAAGGLKVATGSYKCYGHNAWASDGHPSGGEGTSPVNPAVFTLAPFSADALAQLATIANAKR